MEIASKIVLTPAFMVALDELFDRREQKVVALAARKTYTCRVEEATSKAQHQQYHHWRYIQSRS